MLNKIQIQAVHYNLSEKTRTFISEKLSKLDYLKDIITDGEFRIIRDSESYKIEADIHLIHKKRIHIQEDNAQLYPAISNCIHSLRHKLSEEHKIIKSHHIPHAPSIHHANGNSMPNNDDDDDE